MITCGMICSGVFGVLGFNGDLPLGVTKIGELFGESFLGESFTFSGVIFEDFLGPGDFFLALVTGDSVMAIGL
jgi:hypothetical protein